MGALEHSTEESTLSTAAKAYPRSPLAGNPTWQALRDSFFHLLVARTTQRDGGSFGDEADQRLLESLAALQIAPKTSYGSAAVEDLGANLGRHVYAKQLLGDDLEEAMASLAASLERSGVGTLVVEGHFRRTVTVAYHPGKVMGTADDEVRRAYVQGLLAGALGDGLNTEVQIRETTGGSLEIQLRAGRDVNQEVRSSG